MPPATRQQQQQQAPPLDNAELEAVRQQQLPQRRSFKRVASTGYGVYAAPSL